MLITHQTLSACYWLTHSQAEVDLRDRGTCKQEAILIVFQKEQRGRKVILESWEWREGHFSEEERCVGVGMKRARVSYEQCQGCFKQRWRKF